MRVWAWCLLLLLPAAAYAQGHAQALSDAEVEVLRERAPDPPERMQAFVTFLDDRIKAIDKTNAGRRRPGREEDLHDLMEQFTSIANDLDDNLEDYAKRHRDLRKVLPKLLTAAERWATSLRSPPEHDAYNLARKLALEAVADVQQTATELVAEQRTYFLEHPPAKQDPHGKSTEL